MTTKDFQLSLNITGMQTRGDSPSPTKTRNNFIE